MNLELVGWLGAISLIYPLGIVCTAVHEGGHWLMARSHGCRINSVRIGAGTVFQRGRRVQFGLFPVTGAVDFSVPVTSTLAQARLRAIAGPAASAALFGLFCWWSWPNVWQEIAEILLPTAYPGTGATSWNDLVIQWQTYARGCGLLISGFGVINIVPLRIGALRLDGHVALWG